MFKIGILANISGKSSSTTCFNDLSYDMTGIPFSQFCTLSLRNFIRMSFLHVKWGINFSDMKQN
jgi:hypothetical protein